LGLAASVFKFDDDLLLAYLQAKHPNSVVAITPVSNPPTGTAPAAPVSPGLAPLPIDATSTTVPK